MIRFVCSIMVVSALLTGCAVTVGSGIKPKLVAEPATLNDVECQFYILPRLPPTPDIPPLQNAENVSRDIYEEHLLNIISIHRKALIETHRVLQASYQEYIEKCKLGKTTQ